MVQINMMIRTCVSRNGLMPGTGEHINIVMQWDKKNHAHDIQSSGDARNFFTGSTHKAYYKIRQSEHEMQVIKFQDDCILYKT
jgi:hypothetical protein